ncbi:MAG: hypothetical protein NVV73_07285 [Cellvibrionaceae bacterium]|nr:hypothetical protein [Cellvibrionaceae bacterium]
MKNLDEHKKLAVLIDADNAQLSKMKLILEEISAHGHIVTKGLVGIGRMILSKNGGLH